MFFSSGKGTLVCVFSLYGTVLSVGSVLTGLKFSNPYFCKHIWCGRFHSLLQLVPFALPQFTKCWQYWYFSLCPIFLSWCGPKSLCSYYLPKSQCCASLCVFQKNANMISPALKLSHCNLNVKLGMKNCLCGDRKYTWTADKLHISLHRIQERVDLHQLWWHVKTGKPLSPSSLV